VVVPRLKPRGEKAQSTRVDLGEMTPELLPFLGRAAVLQMLAFEAYSSIVADVPDLAVKDAVAQSAGAALTRHEGLVAEIRRRGDDPIDVMQPFADIAAAFSAVITGEDWRESLLGAFVAFGLLDDFFIRLADGLPGDFGPRAAQLLSTTAGEDATVRVLRAAIEQDRRLPSLLAMWGRRIVGDTLLVARAALHVTGNTENDEMRIEPVLTELIAAHTRRMDELGLTS
jgi:hypothetical protein